ncbi:MAG TPA: aminotransferase class V-fold PLP-dependent enzyme [Polyangia bacterium]|jgi:glutamate/tyrosine decarboxylase-like PLP-dependent enzyme|nr:aminotransferase class V-fold PLP-dependent enzyme [Polyangia bacterium]
MRPLDDPSVAEFRALARQVIEAAAEFLGTIEARPVFPHTSGEETARRFDAAIPEEGMGAAALHGDVLGEVAALSRVHHGGFLGYVMGTGLPVAALGELYGAVINQNVTAWRSAPAAVTIERSVVRALAEAVGCAGFAGSLTGGGSPANLMGLCMARETLAPAREDREGMTGGQGGVIYASTEVHMSIPKAAMLLGLGPRGLRRIRVDGRQRMDVAALEAAIVEDRAAGRRPLAVVATAGTVATGAIDPLEEVAEVAARHGLWLHVDGAYGVLAALAAPEKFRGLGRADSLSLDAHKWLYQPVDCGCLLYRDAAAARRAFAHTDDYARSLTEDPVEGFAFFEESLELSRRFRALPLWLSLRYYGLAAFRAAMRQNLEQAQALARRVAEESTLELLAPVELSVVCFRWRGDGEGKGPAAPGLDQRNAALLETVLRRGRVYLSNATVEGKFALRACFTNHRTRPADVEAVVAEVLAAAATGP